MGREVKGGSRASGKGERVEERERERSSGHMEVKEGGTGG